MDPNSPCALHQLIQPLHAEPLLVGLRLRPSPRYTAHLKHEQRGFFLQFVDIVLVLIFTKMKQKTRIFLETHESWACLHCDG